MPGPVGDLLRVEPGRPFRLADVDPHSMPGAADRATAEGEVEHLGDRLAERQEQLYAQGRTGGERRVLLVLQGMDTSGKGGAIKHVAGLMNPAGMRITGFGRPTDVERQHDFLWRFDQALPPAGYLGLFDRSHYEDVLIARVRELVPRETWEARYDTINAWEAGLTESGVVLLKVMLHISADEQRERLLARLDDPAKHWKVNPGDIEERGLWADYQVAYEVALQKCSTAIAPWHVIPADRKWYRNWALSHLLLETFEGLGLEWPRPELDLAGMRLALGASDGSGGVVR